MRNVLQRALDFAIAKEKEAETFYRTWADKAADPAVIGLLNELKAAERGHYEMLSRITVDELIGARETAASYGPDLDTLMTDVVPSPAMSVLDAILLAIRREETSVALYERLAEFRGEAAALFRGLAAEERRHRSRLGTQYEEMLHGDA